MSELDFIAGLRKLPLHEGARDLLDDCAVLPFGDETLIITCDMMARGVHFKADGDPADVAWKLVAVNLSDLAAKGAEPIGLMLGASLAGEDGGAFLEGLGAALKAFNVPLLGGDTIASPSAQTHAITALGRAVHTPVPARSGAKAGDGVFVTGQLGRAMLGFEGVAAHLAAFNRPTPRLTEGRALAPLVTAMMDVSDGLLLDSWRMACASGACLQIEPDAVPVADAARREECVRWGDDYELLFTADPGAHLPVAATRIGTVTASSAEPAVIWGEQIFTQPQGLGYAHS